MKIVVTEREKCRKRLAAAVCREKQRLARETYRRKKYAPRGNRGTEGVKNGKITAKQKGVCKIYVIAANGVKKRIKVTVN